MKHARPNIEEVRKKFDKEWFCYDFEAKPWQGSLGIPTMGEPFTDICQPHLQLDMMSVWNEDSVDGTHFKLYQMCRHKVHIWLDQDYTQIKAPTPKKEWFEGRDFNWNEYHEEVVARPKIVLMECLAGEVISILQGRVDLAWTYHKPSDGAYMMNAVEVEHRAYFNTPKEFILP